MKFKLAKRCLTAGIFGILAWTWAAGPVLPFDFQKALDFQSAHNFLSMILFIIIYAASMAVAIPSLPLNLLSGVLWGTVVGGLLATLGATVGSLVTFILTRWLTGPGVRKKIEDNSSEYFAKTFGKHGLKFVALCRLLPIVPTVPFNVLLGLSNIKLRHFIIITFLFLIPPSMLVANIGFRFKSISMSDADVNEKMTQIIFVSGGLLLLVLAPTLFLAALKLRKGNES